jgi:AcrR family transcriptional regulator
MATSQARERLLTAAVDQAMRGGITDLSLRELAEAIGTSHRMLLYHFGSRVGLLSAVAEAVNQAEAAAFPALEDPRQTWQRFTDPTMWPAERLFFELYAHALYGRPGTEGFFEVCVEQWIALLASRLEQAGTDPAAARAQARLGLAVVRGLLLDLLATGDQAGVAEAYEHFLGPALARLTEAATTRAGELG